MVVSVEVLLAAGYALFLVACAVGLERMARHSHERPSQVETEGFSYDAARDAWECPQGQMLWRSVVEENGERSFVRYRGKAHICNACPMKKDCTDSREGKELVRSLAPWPHSEVGRFHRGISLSLILLALLILAVEAVRYPQLPELLPLTVTLLVTALVGKRLLSTFRRGPANAPSLDALLQVDSRRSGRGR